MQHEIKNNFAFPEFDAVWSFDAGWYTAGKAARSDQPKGEDVLCKIDKLIYSLPQGNAKNFALQNYRCWRRFHAENIAVKRTAVFVDGRLAPTAGVIAERTSFGYGRVQTSHFQIRHKAKVRNFSQPPFACLKKQLSS
uniref:Uncharacterized protein n=1 Tax=Romanomermis culicivorax TaxID=13658 RepID=A0A915IJ84_ROMCU